MAIYNTPPTSPRAPQSTGPSSFNNNLTYVWPRDWGTTIGDNFLLNITDPTVGEDSVAFSLNYETMESNFNFPSAKIIFADIGLLDYLKERGFYEGAMERSLVEALFFSTPRSDVYHLNGLSIPQMSCAPDYATDKSVSFRTTSDFQNFRIFISLYDEATRDGLIYQSRLFDRGELNVETAPVTSSAFSILDFASPLFSAPQAKSELFEEKYLSNIYYTSTVNNEMLGLFAFNMQEFLNLYAAFPSLANATSEWASYVLKAQVYLKKLKKPDNQVVDSTVLADCNVVNNLKVSNSFGKLFFDFSIRDISKIPEYDLELRMWFDDQTKKAAQSYILQLQSNKQDRAATAAIVSLFYTNEDVPVEYGVLTTSDIGITDLEYEKALSDFIGEVASKLEADKTKIVKNNKAATALTYPKFNYPVVPLTSFDFSFLQRIKIQSSLNLNLPLGSSADYNLRSGEGFRFQSATQDNDTITSLSIKSFDLAPALQLIPVFNVTVIKEVLASDKLRNDVNNDINCGEADEIQSVLTSFTPLPKFVSLTTVKDQKYEFEYLDSLNIAVSGFAWKDLTDNVLTQLVADQVILVRVKGHSEYYNGIFYLLGGGGS